MMSRELLTTQTSTSSSGNNDIRDAAAAAAAASRRSRRQLVCIHQLVVHACQSAGGMRRARGGRVEGREGDNACRSRIDRRWLPRCGDLVMI